MTLEPFKIIGQLVACEKDENDAIIGERVVAEMVLYAPQFGELEQRVRDAWPDIEAAVMHEQAPTPFQGRTATAPAQAGNGGPAGLARAPKG
jgi:hypothetical protein